MALVLIPVAGSGNESIAHVAAISGLRGKVIGFLDNSKRNFSNLAEDMAGILQTEHGVASIIRRSKSNPAEPDPDTIIAELATACDLVITGSGD